MPQVQIVEGDAFDKDQIRSFVVDVDVVVCCYLGDDNLMIDGQKALIDACEEAKVPRYIASDWTLDFTKLKLDQLFPKDPMKHVKSYLETKKNVRGVHILVGGFMDAIFSSFFNVFDPQSNTFMFWGEGNEVWEGTSYDNAAEYTAAIALDSQAVGIQRMLGGRTTIRELSESFQEIYGIKPNLKRLGSLDDLFKHMNEVRAQQPENFLEYIPLFLLYYWTNGQTNVGPETDNFKYPNILPVSWEDFMKSRTLEQLKNAYESLASGP
ncbi:unnamed protein product [Umbelopsis ramanniana]